jgi:hypothetical protein
MARILPYQQELGARYYLGKYLTKELADVRFSPVLQCELTRTEAQIWDVARIRALYS